MKYDDIAQTYFDLVTEGKFIDTHKGVDDFGFDKPNPRHPMYAKHKAEYDAKVKDFKSNAISLKKPAAEPKKSIENPVQLHHIDAAISAAYPDVDPYDHLARKFPDLHRASGKEGSKLTDFANKTVRAHTKHKSLSDYADAAYKELSGE